MVPPHGGPSDFRFDRPPSLETTGILRRRLQLLLGGRLVVATLLLGAALWVGVRGEAEFSRFTPSFLSLLIASTYGACIVFALWLVRTRNVATQAAIQIGFDVAVATALIYVTGGVGSAFSFLYGISVLVAALTIGPRAALFVAGASLLAYLTIGLSVVGGWIPHPPDQPPERYLLPPQDTAFSIFRNLIGLIVVSLLAQNLSSRLLETGGELKRAAESAFALARLNDDIVRSMTSGLMSTDLSGTIFFINPAGAEMLRAQEGEIIGSLASTFLPVDLSQGRSRGDLRQDGEAVRLDGSRFAVGYSVGSLCDISGHETGVLIMFQDLTEIQELRDAAARADRLATLGRLAAGLAHEIRNPLSSISGSVELVRESPHLGDEDRQLLRLVLGEVE
ncbi:MAG: PAS domain S-box protein, partial [Myxococcales bacterium]|nr:PAS domain S-box protein [Myxococcales bacterium]